MTRFTLACLTTLALSTAPACTGTTGDSSTDSTSGSTGADTTTSTTSSDSSDAESSDDGFDYTTGPPLPTTGPPPDAETPLRLPRARDGLWPVDAPRLP